jgi:hypothetical protein
MGKEHQMSEKHTPLPWKVGLYGGIYPVSPPNSAAIVSADTPSGPLPNHIANEALIVAAVNSYPSRQRLVDALRLTMEALMAGDPVDGSADQSYVIPGDKVIAALSEARTALAGLGEKP